MQDKSLAGPEESPHSVHPNSVHRPDKVNTYHYQDCWHVQLTVFLKLISGKINFCKELLHPGPAVCHMQRLVIFKGIVGIQKPST